MPGRFNAPVEEHQQSGHQEKDRQHGTHNPLAEDDTHVKANAELHEHQGHQAGNGGQRG